MNQVKSESGIRKLKIKYLKISGLLDHEVCASLVTTPMKYFVFA